MKKLVKGIGVSMGVGLVVSMMAVLVMGADPFDEAKAKALSGVVMAVVNGGTGATTAAAARTNLGLGTIATQAYGSVSITGGSISGITDLAVADGGTGASTAAAARTNLGVPSVYTGTLVAMPVTTGKVKGDIYVADSGEIYICKALGADTTGWALVTN